VTLAASVSKIRFVGQTGTSWSGDMAIDDIKFVASSGPTSTKPTTTTATTTNTGTGNCSSWCLNKKTNFDWWAADAAGQVMPKCARWECNGCPMCAAVPSRCIKWCYDRPFGGWAVSLHTCQVFEGCKDCQFCGGTISFEVAPSTNSTSNDGVIPYSVTAAPPAGVYSGANATPAGGQGIVSRSGLLRPNLFMFIMPVACLAWISV